MKVIPVLDLRNGVAVHARGGERARYAPLVSPLAGDAQPGAALPVVAAYARLVPRSPIYVADLDAIGGATAQTDLVASIAASGPGSGVWVDGGIASAADVEAWAAVRGVRRLIVGLETLRHAAALAHLIQATRVHGLDAAFSLDVRNGVPIVRGSSLGGRTPEDLAAMAAAAGCACVIVIDLARVGSGRGLDESLVGRVAAAAPGMELIVGGGVHGGEDLRRLAALGVHGALVGTALHDGRIGPREIAAVAG